MCRGATLLAAPLSQAPSLGVGAAVLHGAPPSRLVLAVVYEEPPAPAVFDVAHAEMTEVNVAQQVNYSHSHTVLDQQSADGRRS